MFQTCFAGGARLISIQSSNAQEANTAYVIMRTGSHTSWAIDIKVLTADDTGAGCHFPAITQSKPGTQQIATHAIPGPEFWLGAWAPFLRSE
jgi:hypothetical protein